MSGKMKYVFFSRFIMDIFLLSELLKRQKAAFLSGLSGAVFSHDQMLA